MRRNNAPHDLKEYSPKVIGAPRSVKMGTTASPRSYGACHAKEDAATLVPRPIAPPIPMVVGGSFFPTEPVGSPAHAPNPPAQARARRHRVEAARLAL
jgi:hypothetical protein